MTSHARRRNVAGALLAATVALSMTACGGSGSSAADANTMTVSYSQVVADQLPLWIADESGLFTAQGLKVTLTNLSGSDGFPALVSGQTQLASIGGSEMVSGAASGGEVNYLATLTPVFPYELFAKVTDPQQLKGKRIGVTSTSGSLYVATLEALKQIGLSPSDVQLTPLGSVTNVNNALVAGTIDAALSHPPATTQIEAAGYHSLVDLAKDKIPASNVGIAATTDYVKGHGDQIRRFLAAVQQAITREKSDEAYSTSVLSKHLNVTDPAALHETWQYYAQEALPDVPTPTVAQLQTSVTELAPSVPAVKSLDVAKIVNTSFVTPAG
ncbi:ABC transporter substrate-binding protein [Pseudonocardia alaniniphila]|uniref:ABC transporter substrate-binding protein n=1 Tax=Pseudonocardia alaniniphila TaxID=75291 RepID=A0ABS9TPN9_9PSEU|nr:ABC transporter substrate-binding protein [Pseudonocardia alaniniphila]MCH6170196.1 ABC transporter substrate-binding protein [Pseudonocardia alaniniphila]